MYPLGHMGLAYFAVYLFKKIKKGKANLLLVLWVSLLPDFDIFFTSIIQHRALSHSIITISLIFFPLYLVYKTGFSYYISALTHPLIGDYFTAYGVKLLWPISNEFYIAPYYFIMEGQGLMIIEIILFLGAILHYIIIKPNEFYINSP